MTCRPHAFSTQRERLLILLYAFSLAWPLSTGDTGDHNHSHVKSSQQSQLRTNHASDADKTRRFLHCDRDNVVANRLSFISNNPSPKYHSIILHDDTSCTYILHTGSISSSKKCALFLLLFTHSFHPFEAITESSPSTCTREVATCIVATRHIAMLPTHYFGERIMCGKRFPTSPWDHSSRRPHTENKYLHSNICYKSIKICAAP